jgi:hypothetical protein
LVQEYIFEIVSNIDQTEKCNTVMGRWAWSVSVNRGNKRERNDNFKTFIEMQTRLSKIKRILIPARRLITIMQLKRLLHVSRGGKQCR